MSTHRPCLICDKKIGLYEANNRVYCSDACYHIAKAAKQRTIKQAIQMDVIREGKICKRCQKRVHEPSMRTYCKPCGKIMNTRERVRVRKVCATDGCEENIRKTKTYCEACRVKRAKAAVVTQTEGRKQLRKEMAEIQPVGEKSTINPMFLTRGKISNRGSH